MKKALLALGLSSALIFAGCGQDEGQDVQEEQNNGNADVVEISEKEIKSSLLDTQMSLTTELRSLHQTILAYEGKIGAEDVTEEDLLKAADEAKAAAEEAVSKLDSFEMTGTFTEDIENSLKEALDSLKTSYQERLTAIEADPANPDLSKAEEAFGQFVDQLGSIFEEVGLLAPDMAKELS
ncbi:MAG: hypothetical protein H0Z32_00970 [Bacillaceae bacterium]|nr:hypothetical protein [Bacillaceae bacterium]